MMSVVMDRVCSMSVVVKGHITLMTERTFSVLLRRLLSCRCTPSSRLQPVTGSCRFGWWHDRPQMDRLIGLQLQHITKASLRKHAQQIQPVFPGMDTYPCIQGWCHDCQHSMLRVMLLHLGQIGSVAAAKAVN